MIALQFSYTISRFFKRSLIIGQPYAANIEPLNLCNLQCPECPTGLKILTRPKGTMSTELFAQTLSHLGKQLWYVNLYFQGEPYMHPNFLELVSMAKNKKMVVGTSTNGHYLTKTKALKTVESGLDRLIISLDGTTQETYERYRKGGDINKVLEGIKNVNEAKKELNKSHPLIIVQFLVFKHNQHQLNDIKQLAQELEIDKLEIKTAQIYNANSKKEFITTINKYSRYETTNSKKITLKGKFKNHCWKQWSSTVVTWNGQTAPCCFDKDAQHNMGNISNTPIKTIWKNLNYNTFRNKVLQKQSSINICQNCPIAKK